MVANPSTGPTSVAELIARARAAPEGLTYGSTGVNSGQHLTMEILKAETEANLVHVPYRGSAPAMVDLIAESGIKGLGRAGGFIGLFAPAATPRELVQRLSAEVRDISSPRPRSWPTPRR